MVEAVEHHIRAFHLRIQGIDQVIGAFLHDVDIVVVVFVLVLFLVVENDVLLVLVDVWLKDFVRSVGQFLPFVGGIFEVVESDFWISIADTDVVAFTLENP